jgi:hypothetical protein
VSMNWPVVDFVVNPVPEDASAGYLVATLPAPTLNGDQVVCSFVAKIGNATSEMIETVAPIAVDRTTGEVRVVGMLDSEGQSVYRLHVAVVAVNGQPLFETAILEIKVDPVLCPKGSWSETGTFPCEIITHPNTFVTTTTAQPSTIDGELENPCPNGTWSASGTAPCRAVTLCPKGQIESAPTATSDRYCSKPCFKGTWSQSGFSPCKLTATCGKGLKQIQQPTQTSDRRCAAWCLKGTTWSRSGTSEKAPCKATTPCKDGQFEVKPPTRKRDRLCSKQLLLSLFGPG